jgi:hypothetical protein
MPKTLRQHSIQWGLTTVVLAILTVTATGGSFTRGCAARDV